MNYSFTKNVAIGKKYKIRLWCLQCCKQRSYTRVYVVHVVAIVIKKTTRIKTWIATRSTQYPMACSSNTVLTRTAETSDTKPEGQFSRYGLKVMECKRLVSDICLLPHYFHF